MGNICEWPFIRELADKHNLKILVDSADTIGATYDGISTGSFADVVITDFMAPTSLMVLEMEA